MEVVIELKILNKQTWSIFWGGGVTLCRDKRGDHEVHPASWCQAS